MNTTITNNWQSYKVGTIVKIADGREFEIVEVETKTTSKGYRSRLFHLVNNATGDRVVKTSRGLSLWAAGKSGDADSVVADDVVDGSETETVAETNGSVGETLAEVIARAIAPYAERAEANAGVDRDEVAKIVDERLAAVAPQRIEVARLDGTVVDVGVQHVQFPALLAAVAARRNVWLVGPAGSGKTSAAHAVAESLGLRFYAKSVGPQTSESSLLGYHDANGKVVRTQLRDAYENGGVFLLDEVDAANPAVLVVINQLLANGHASFPDAVIAKHPDFVLVAGANTIGQGADRQYVGRQQIDAATLDRFCLLEWAYDPRIEAAACGLPVEVFSEAPAPVAIKLHDVSTDADREVAEGRVVAYVKRVVAIRNAVAALGKGVRVIVSPRANINGSALIRVGYSIDAALDACVWKGIDKDTRSKIESNC